jgi:hypothetical protein
MTAIAFRLFLQTLTASNVPAVSKARIESVTSARYAGAWRCQNGNTQSRI